MRPDSGKTSSGRLGEQTADCKAFRAFDNDTSPAHKLFRRSGTLTVCYSSQSSRTLQAFDPHKSGTKVETRVAGVGAA